MEPTKSLLGPDDDNRVAGEVVIKVSGASAAAVSARIPRGPARLAASVPTATGVESLDNVLRELGCQAITAVHGPMAAPALMAVGEERALELSGTLRVRVAPDVDLDEAVSKLRRLPEVAQAEPNRWRFAQTTTPNDPMFGLEWGLQKIRAPEAWDTQRGDRSIPVAVVDTGVDLDHPDLAAQLLPGQDLVDLTGVAPDPGTHFEGDVLTRDSDPQDEVDHGTHVAGTISALTDNAEGVAGVSWFCSMIPVRVLARIVVDADGSVSGTGTSVDIAAGIRWAADNGAKVINLSLGGFADTFVERDAVAYAVTQDVVVVAAMGNENTTTPSFPAAYPGVIAVGAIDQNDQRASFSNRGPHISVVAPGVDVRSTLLDDTYGDLSGTSMATPHVAGLAGLLRSCNPGLTAAQVRDLLRSTARPLRDSPSDLVPNVSYGSGLVDAKATVDVACGGLPIPALPYPGRLLRHPPLMPGADVFAWQQRMSDRGFVIGVDGLYGPQSKGVCTSFQQQQGLQVDGVVGPITWAATFGP
jgi:subtilisin family serine protease